MKPELKENQRRLLLALRRTIRLVNLNAPEAILAHSFIKTVFPKVCASIGTKYTSMMLAEVIQEGLNLKSSTCTMCSVQPATDFGTICLKCFSEQEKFEAQMDAEESEIDDEELEDDSDE